MVSFLLMRDNVKLGPYTLEQLKLTGIRPTDMLWIDGKSTSWLYPDEIEGLQAFIHHRSDNPLDREGSIPTFKIKLKEDLENKANPGTWIPDSGNQSSSSRPFPQGKPPLTPENSPADQKATHAGTANPETPIRIIIADDHTLFREGVTLALSQKPDIKIIGEAENGMHLLQMLKYNMPDLVLLDIQMPIMDGITTLASIRSRYPELKVIMLTMHNESSMVAKLMGMGANAYLTKTSDSETMYEAIRTCQFKNYFFNDLTNRSILERMRSLERTDPPPQTYPQTQSPPFSPEQKSQARLPDARTMTKTRRSRIWKKALRIALSLVLILGLATAGVLFYISHSNAHTDPVILATPGVAASLANDSSRDKKADSLRQLPISTDSGSLASSAQAVNLSDTVAVSGDSSQRLATENPLKDAARISTPGSYPTKKKADMSDKKISGEDLANSIRRENPNKSILRKAYAKKNIRHLVTVFCNHYETGVQGGISHISMTVYNQTIYPINAVSVEIKYMMADSTLVKTEIINVREMPPLTSKVIRAAGSANGSKMSFQIKSIQSDELGL